MERAVEAGPEFIQSDGHHPSMFQSVGWQITEQDDIIGAFIASTERMIAAEKSRVSHCGHCVVMTPMKQPK